MLDRVKRLREAGRLKWSGRAGILAKCAKPQQDLRVDMPTIGPKTVKAAAETGFAGIAVEAGRVMIVERPDVIALADRSEVFIVGVADLGSTRLTDGPFTAFLIAGEESGDHLGARLMEAMKERLGDDVRFVGVGGARMEAHGLTSLFPMHESPITVFPRSSRTFLGSWPSCSAPRRRDR